MDRVCKSIGPNYNLNHNPNFTVTLILPANFTLTGCDPNIGVLASTQDKTRLIN